MLRRSFSLTLFIALLKPVTGELVYINAGRFIFMGVESGVKPAREPGPNLEGEVYP